jgi:hypothetical protein
MSSYLCVAALTVGTLFVPAASFAAAVEFTNAPVSHDSQLSIGFVFTTNEAVNITSLGYYDENQDGFLTDHEVGIFDSNGQLLVSTILAAGSGASLVGHYRYSSVPAITLAAHSSFVTAATTFGPLDGWAYGNQGSTITGFIIDPSINVASDASRFIYQSDNILRAPDQMFGHTIYGGPNFIGTAIEVSGVPEPASAALALSGLAGLLFFSRKKRQGASS